LQARVELHADNGFVALCFAAPVVEWLREEKLGRLGPDATTDGFDATEALRRLRTLDAMPLERALLTQSAMAGVGNVIKCEALFIDRRDPLRPVAALADADLSALIDRCHRLLVRNRTAGPRTSRDSLDGGRLWVYGRGGKPCRVCGAAIRIARTARLTWYCAHCQR
jgi:endonuclease-8